MISRRLDLSMGVLLVERHPLNVLLDIPRDRQPPASLAELNDVIAELMAVRESWIEEPTFLEKGLAHA